jgi:hypothetical protein
MRTKRSHARRRPLALVGAAALAVTVIPTGPVAAQEAPPGSRGIDRVCPAPEDAAVTDVPVLGDVAGTTHEQSITCALEYGLVRGFGDGTYRPGTPVTRGQMATFVKNWIETATGLDFVDVPPTTLTDVAGTTHAESIDALVEFGVVSGRANGTFAPDAPVTRGQMARFVTGALDLADTLEVDGSLPPDTDVTYFTDVTGTTFASEIRAIAEVGIVQGIGGNRYAPTAPVTRGQVATFLMGGADYLDRNQRWEPTSVIVEYEVALSGENEVDPTTGAFGAGEPTATGTATLTIDAFRGELDVELRYDDVTGPFDGEGTPGAHIHAGAIDENGPIVVTLATGAELEAGDGTWETTVIEDVTEFRFAELVEDPDAYYVNLHSDDFPAGAVRGQLPLGGQDLLAATEFEVTMTGEAELDDTVSPVVLGVGEGGGSAPATIEVDYVNGEIGYSVDISGVTGPFAAAPGFHIHAGAADENGPIVAFLADGADVQAAVGSGTLSGTFTDASPSLLRALVQNPDGYYVNLHSDLFVPGAVRAQLD